MSRSIRVVGSFALVAALLGSSATASAQVSRSGLLSDQAVRQFGLTRSWFTQVELDQGKSRVSYVTPFVSSESFHTVYDVVWETGEQEFSEVDRDPFGELVGKEGALKSANAKIEELKTGGLDPKLVTRIVPEITLYVATDRGVIHAIDAETGKTRWARAVGRPEHPNLEPGVNEEYLGVVNGSILYVVDRKTGKLIWERKLGGAPGAGAALSDEFVFVPLVNGHVEMYRLSYSGDETKGELERRFRPPTIHVSIGRNLLQPTCTPTVCAWPSDRGFMYVAHANKEGLLYRTEANDTIVASVTYDAKRMLLLMASVDGYVYAVHANSGDVMWRFSTGAAISYSPRPIGDSVYVVTDEGGLFKIDAETGLEQWWTPRVREFLAASDDRVYCTDRIGRLLIIDAKSGGRLGMLATEQLDLFIPNHLTDRVYLGTKTGLLQCLRGLNLERPIVYAGPGSEAQETIQVKVGAPADPATPMPAASDDPFGTGAGGTTPAADPFGTGTGGTAPAADPFGTTP